MNDEWVTDIKDVPPVFNHQFWIFLFHWNIDNFLLEKKKKCNLIFQEIAVRSFVLWYCQNEFMARTQLVKKN